MQPSSTHYTEYLKYSNPIYSATYDNLWCIMTNMTTFCLNFFFSISHLQNLSSYEVIYGRKTLAMNDLLHEVDDLTCPPFYHFTNYPDILNE